MSDVDLLRRAAALMRERAQAVTSGAWRPVRVISDHTVAAITLNESIEDNDGEHIAGWSPAVAITVADWLDRMVNEVEEAVSQGQPAWIVSTFDTALAVARAYLGEDV